MKDLEELRKEIDVIDRQLVALFEQRMEVVTGGAEYKLAHGLPVLNAGREQRVLEKCVSLLENKDYSDAVTRWMQVTMALSREAQEKFLAQGEPRRTGRME